MKEPIYMVDASAPFFVRHKRRKDANSHNSINWSKAPTHELTRDGKVKKKTHKKIREGFELYVKRLSRLGYNAVSIDELAYLLWPTGDCQGLPVQKWVKKYRKHYRRLLEISVDHGMTPYLTSDVWYAIHTPAGMSRKALFDHMARSMDALLEDFPELGGIILRIGESDGVDVISPFRSQLLLKRPAHLRQCLQALLPVFERHSRMLIFRTWTLGAGKIGDLLWNRSTLNSSLPEECLKSESFLLSYKFSQSDFTRYQPLNPFALNSPAPYILELQTRREYEGFGEFPCFVGFDYASYARQLRQNRMLRGIHVWCQTGGWSRFRNFSFLKRRSYFNELNTAVTLELFKNQGNVDRALEKSGFKGQDLSRMKRFLELSDDLIKQVLYIPSFAARTLFINRSRIPPLVHILWDRITVTSLIAFMIQVYSRDVPSDLKKSDAAMAGLPEMRKLARKLNIDYDIDFHEGTMELMQLSQRALISPDHASGKALADYFQNYRMNYPGTYELKLQIETSPGIIRKPILGSVLRLFIRDQPKYRFFDKVLFGLSGPFIVYVLLPVLRRYLPGTLDQQAMPLAELIR